MNFWFLVPPIFRGYFKDVLLLVWKMTASTNLLLAKINRASCTANNPKMLIHNSRSCFDQVHLVVFPSKMQPTSPEKHLFLWSSGVATVSNTFHLIILKFLVTMSTPICTWHPRLLIVRTNSSVLRLESGNVAGPILKFDWKNRLCSEWQ